MNPEDIESNVKRIVGGEIKKSQNDFYLSWIIYFLLVSKHLTVNRRRARRRR
jgi:hypothetical protein